MSDILLHDESDAVFAPNTESAWVKVKEFAIHISKTDEGVVVDVYADRYEDCDALVSTQAFDADAKAMQEEEVADESSL